jgi:alkylation response protein AidB-like acyl-CoA dehydrogenase
MRNADCGLRIGDRAAQPVPDSAIRIPHLTRGMIMTTVAGRTDSYLEAARALVPDIRALAEQIDAERQLPRSLVLRLAEAGLFKMYLPAARGGGGASLPATLAVIEEVARADGSTGWCVAQGINTFRQSLQLREDIARTFFFSDPVGVSAGSSGVRGTAVPVPGGYRVTGRWSFATGCMHASTLHGGAAVLDGDTPRLRDNGMPDERIFYFPLDAAVIEDTWHVSGMRGTGSHDVVVSDLFVPEEHSFPRNVIRAAQTGPAAVIPGYDLAALNFACVGLGVARAAIDEVINLATVKIPRNVTTRLVDRALTQHTIAQAEATRTAGRAMLFAIAEELWATVTAGERVQPAQRGRTRLAATHAAVSAAQAVELALSIAGSTPIFLSSPLDRYRRDVHTVTTHIQLQPINYEAVGRMMLGLESNSPMF